MMVVESGLRTVPPRYCLGLLVLASAPLLQPAARSPASLLLSSYEGKCCRARVAPPRSGRCGGSRPTVRLWYEPSQGFEFWFSVSVGYMLGVGVRVSAFFFLQPLDGTL